MPRELAERRVLMDHYEQQRKLLKMKDDIIWNLVQERQKQQDHYEAAFDKSTRDEMHEWAKLVDLYAAELKKYQVVCSFCGGHLDEKIVNTVCPFNTGAGGAGARGGAAPARGAPAPRSAPASKAGAPAAKGGKLEPGEVLTSNDVRPEDWPFYTDEEPPKESQGGGKHYFGKPSVMGYKQNPFKPQAFNHLTDEVVLQNVQSALALRKVKIAVEENGIDLTE